MKFVTLFILTFASVLSSAQASRPSHHCHLNAVVQHYDLATMKLMSTEELKSGWFDVTVEPHEDQKDIDFQGSKGTIGTAKVWTGTLMSTSEGDLIQAHATFVIEGATGSASIFMSLDSRFAKTTIALDSQTTSEFLLISVDLKCEQN